VAGNCWHQPLGNTCSLPVITLPAVWSRETRAVMTYQPPFSATKTRPSGADSTLIGGLSPE